MKNNTTKSGKREKFNFESFVIDNYLNGEVIKYAFVGLGQGGGKISIEFNLMNYYASLFNTAKSDLAHAIEILSTNNDTITPSLGYISDHDKYMVEEDNYKVTPFGKLGGAKKDRYFGKEAVVGNFNLLKDRLVTDKNISDADFVWVAASLGGGTASGAVTDIVKIISGFIRKDDKRFGYREGTKVQRALQGTPTVGVIALWPEESASPKVKLNAAEALQELSKLHQEGLLGNILLIDNQKLLDEAINNNIDDWQKYCNARIVQHLTEASILTSVSSDTSVDRAELMEIITQPGFLNITKSTYDELDIYSENDTKTNKKSIDSDKCTKLASDIVTNSHFTEQYSKEGALRTIFMTLTHENHPSFNKTIFYKLQSEVAKIQDTAIVNHQGMYQTKRMVTANQAQHKMQLSQTTSNVKLDNSNSIIFYYLCVYKHMPVKYIEIIKEAIEKRDRDLKAIKQREDSLKDLSVSSQELQYQPVTEVSDNFDDFANDLEKTLSQSIKNDSNSEDSFEDFLNNSNFGTTSNDIYQVEAEEK